MWVALANCYEKLGMNDEAIKCTQRAERVKDKEAIALHKLAKLYLLRGEEDKAAQCFQDNLTRLEKENLNTNETVEALRFLAHYYRQREEHQLAHNYETRL
jgi:anaphase-promoting complex subunit 8